MKITRTITLSALVLGALILIPSCQRTDLSGSGNHQRMKIVPNVSSTSLTKGGGSIEDEGNLIATYAISEDPEKPLYLQVFECDFPDYLGDAITTKGTELTTDNITSFNMKAYAEDEWYDPSVPEGQPGSMTSKYSPGTYFDALSVTRTEGGEWEMSRKEYWQQDVTLTFWSWNAVQPAVTFSDGSDKATISNFVLDGDSPVEQQKDVLVAYNRERRTFENGKVTDNKIDIHFQHALSAIKFDVSGLDGAELKKLTIKNIINIADCNITVPSSGVNAGIPQFEWIPFGWGGEYFYADFSESFTSSDFNADGSMKEGSGKVMFLIPQTLGDDAAIEVSLADSSLPSFSLNHTCSIAKINPSDTENVRWKPGKYYIYKLTADPFSYTWQFQFNLKTASDKLKSVSVKESDVTTMIDINSIRFRQDKPSVKGDYGFHIKSYKVEGGSEQTVADGTFDEATAGMSNVRVEDGQLVIPIASRTLIARGSNRYWRDAADKLVNPLWHPDDWRLDEPVDLSKMDYRKDDINEAENAFQMSTANCYVIRHAGRYKIPLVYGNGVLNGAPNTAAYKPLPGQTSETDHILGTFVNHLDQEITSPFIENNAGCDVESYEILWQANGPVVTDLRLTGTQKSTDDYNVNDVRYLEFTADPQTICQNNTLICIKDAEGRIIWSWEIWTTNDPELLEDPIEVTGRTNAKYWFQHLPSIGRVLNQEYPERKSITITLEQDSPSTEPPITVTIKQPAYANQTDYVVFQWGRKDPIRGRSTAVEMVDAPESIGYAIQHPNAFLHYAMDYEGGARIINSCPFTFRAGNLWTGKHTAAGPADQNSNMIKTIYDPSPIGYKVPASGAFSGFTTTGKEEFFSSGNEGLMNIESTNVTELKGANFYTSLGPGYTVNHGTATIWFPFDGYRAGYSGNVQSSKAMYYAANVASYDDDARNIDSYDLRADSNAIGLSAASTCNAHNIRPVTDPQFTAWWTNGVPPSATAD